MMRASQTVSSALGSSNRATRNWPPPVISRGVMVFLMALSLAGCQSSSLPAASLLVVRTMEQSLTIPDGLFAHIPSQVRSIIVTTKIIPVESAEIVYLNNVVTPRMDDGERWD
jgi:hypothetical protein